MDEIMVSIKKYIVFLNKIYGYLPCTKCKLIHFVEIALIPQKEWGTDGRGSQMET